MTMLKPSARRILHVLSLSCLALVLAGCASKATPHYRAHTIVQPPPGKAVIYFLVDWPATNRSVSGSFGCALGREAFIELNIDGMKFSELGFGTWTYLFVEPADIPVFMATRYLESERFGDQCIVTTGQYGETSWAVDLKAESDQAYFFKYPGGKRLWEQVDESAVHGMLDYRNRECTDCPGRTYDNVLFLDEPNEGHYIGPKYDLVQCIQNCYKTGGKACQQRCDVE